MRTAWVTPRDLPENDAVLTVLRDNATLIPPSSADFETKWGIDGYELRTHPENYDALLQLAAGLDVVPTAAYGVAALASRSGVIVALARGQTALHLRLPPPRPLDLQAPRGWISWSDRRLVEVQPILPDWIVVSMWQTPTSAAVIKCLRTLVQQAVARVEGA